MLDSRAVDRTLAEVRSGLAAPAAARERVRARLEAGGAFAEPLAAAPGGNPASPVPTYSVARSTVAVLVGIGFGVGYWLGMHHPASGPVPGASSSVVAASASLPAPALEPTLQPTLPAPPEAPLPPVPAEPAAAIEQTSDTATRAAEPKRPPRPRSHAAPGASKNGFGDELVLLQRAERALRAGEAELALSFVHELERRYPGSPLREERAAARVMAECALNRAGAFERGALFLRDRPASVYSDRVLQLCTLEAAAEPREGGH